MQMKSYLLIYDERRFLYSGYTDDLKAITIDKNSTIETFDTQEELTKRKAEINNEIISRTENPTKYYEELKDIADRIELISRKLYTNRVHCINVDDEVNEFDDCLMKIISIIRMDLIHSYCLDEEDN